MERYFVLMVVGVIFVEIVGGQVSVITDDLNTNAATVTDLAYVSIPGSVQTVWNAMEQAYVSTANGDTHVKCVIISLARLTCAL